MIGMIGERKSRKSMLAVLFDDDDDTYYHGKNTACLRNNEPNKVCSLKRKKTTLGLCIIKRNFQVTEKRFGFFF